MALPPPQADNARRRSFAADFANMGLTDCLKSCILGSAFEAEETVMSTQRRYSYYFTLYGFCDTGCLRCAA